MIPENPVTLVLGASMNPNRYSNRAVELLQSKGYAVVALGKKSGTIGNTAVHEEWNFEPGSVDTVSLYLRPILQDQFLERILALKPRRVIFNPGTEHPNLYKLLNQAGIQTESACTLVLLSTGTYFT